MKALMNGYVGVKFSAIQITQEVPPFVKVLFARFKRSAESLREYGMTPKNGGNISLKRAKGFIITSSGSNLGTLEESEIVYVQRCSIEEQQVEYAGENVPSSETFLHYLIYRCRPDIEAVVHAHDPKTAMVSVSSLKETPKEEAYGTPALARMACKTFSKKERIIVLKNHGYVAIGKTLDEAVDLIVSAHLNPAGK